MADVEAAGVAESASAATPLGQPVAALSATPPEPEAPGPWDHLFHDPRIGYPKPTREQVAEMVATAEKRLAGVKLTQRPRRPDYRRMRMW